MFRLSILPTQSTFILSKTVWVWQVIHLLLIYSLSSPLFAYGEWTLSGTYINGTQQHAIFVDNLGNEMRWENGEVIQGCKLIEVLPESATLNCEEGLYNIPLRQSVGEVYQPEYQTKFASSERFINISKQDTKELFAQQQRLVSEISFLPKVEDDHIVGLSVSKIRPNSQAAQLGLHNGDVIQSINGVSAASHEEFIHTINQLGEMPQVSIQIDRFGELLNYTYIFK